MGKARVTLTGNRVFHTEKHPVTAYRLRIGSDGRVGHLRRLRRRLHRSSRASLKVETKPTEGNPATRCSWSRARGQGRGGTCLGAGKDVGTVLQNDLIPRSRTRTRDPSVGAQDKRVGRRACFGPRFDLGPCRVPTAVAISDVQPGDSATTPLGLLAWRVGVPIVASSLIMYYPSRSCTVVDRPSPTIENPGRRGKRL